MPTWKDTEGHQDAAFYFWVQEPMKLILPGSIYDGADVASLYQTLCFISKHSSIFALVCI